MSVKPAESRRINANHDGDKIRAFLTLSEKKNERYILYQICISLGRLIRPLIIPQR